MVKLIIGHKGSGKTKKLVEAVNATTEQSHGNVGCIEKGETMNFSVTHKARLINIDTYGISGFDAFYGMLCGICAGNYDVTDIFADATLKIVGKDFEHLCDFFDRVQALSEETNTNFCFTVSADEAELPAKIFDIAEKY